MVHLGLLEKMDDLEAPDNLVNLDRKVFKGQEVSMDVMAFLVLPAPLEKLFTKILMDRFKILFKAKRAKKVNEVYQDNQVMMVQSARQVFQVKTDLVAKMVTKVMLVHLENEVIPEAWVDSSSQNIVKLNKYRVVQRVPLDYGTAFPWSPIRLATRLFRLTSDPRVHALKIFK